MVADISFDTQLQPPSSAVVQLQEIPPAPGLAIDLQPVPTAAAVVAQACLASGGLQRGLSLTTDQQNAMNTLLANAIGACKQHPDLGNATSLYLFDLTNGIVHYNDAAGTRQSHLIDDLTDQAPQLATSFEALKKYQEENRPGAYQRSYTFVSKGMGPAQAPTPCNRSAIAFAAPTLHHNNFSEAAKKALGTLLPLPANAPAPLIASQNEMAKKIARAEKFHTLVLADFDAKIADAATPPAELPFWTQCRRQWADVDAFAVSAAIAYLPANPDNPVQAINKANALADIVRQEIQRVYNADQKAMQTWKTRLAFWRGHPPLNPTDYAGDIGALVLAGMNPVHARKAYAEYSDSQKITHKRDGLEATLVRAITRHTTQDAQFQGQFTSWITGQDASVQADLRALFARCKTSLNAAETGAGAARDTAVAGAANAAAKLAAARTALGIT